MGGGLIIAAPHSGSGKTTLTLGLLRALSRRGPVRGAKSGPDYIDPKFHEAASGAPCVNLDAWAMSPARLQALAAGKAPLVIEGAMGLFDGAPPDGRGACADLARLFGLPVVLVVDASRMAQSVAAIVGGFAAHDPAVKIAGIVLNKVGSPRHEAMLRRALAGADLPPVLGAVPRDPALAHPSRHLGLVQAHERPDLDQWLDAVGDHIAAHVDLAALPFAPLQGAPAPVTPAAPPAQHIAVAQDAAFGFAYPHMLADWRAAGAQITPFSPLADEAPAPDAGMIFLPGGYPELHAGQIAQAANFRAGMLRAARTGTAIYGECGGYMVLGEGLVDATGARHEMLGLLGLETSFAQRKLHLGYRHLQACAPFGLGDAGAVFTGHEFHYASTLNAKGAPLFAARDAEGTALADAGLVAGRIAGSFAHIIDRAQAHQQD